MITTPVGAASEAENVFDDENSIIVAINDNNALKNAILMVLNKQIDFEMITRKNFHDFRSRFDVGSVANQMKQIYEEVLGKD